MRDYNGISVSLEKTEIEDTVPISLQIHFRTIWKDKLRISYRSLIFTYFVIRFSSVPVHLNIKNMFLKTCFTKTLLNDFPRKISKAHNSCQFN